MQPSQGEDQYSTSKQNRSADSGGRLDKEKKSGRDWHAKWKRRSWISLQSKTMKGTNTKAEVNTCMDR